MAKQKVLNVLMSTLFATSAFALAAPASAETTNWEGTANYGADTVEFDRYDFGVGVVLLEPTNVAATAYDGYYQSFVTNHQLGAMIAESAGLNDTYELTATASFSEVASGPNTFALNPGGVFNLYLDTTPDRDFNADSGFNDDVSILQGEIVSGSSALLRNTDGSVTGFGDLSVKITGYDTNVFEPDTLTNGSSIFTLSFNNSADSEFLAGINSVQGRSFDADMGDQLGVADGSLVLQVPEPETYAMMLAGLGLVGVAAARRKRS